MNTHKMKILLISYHFPPSNAVGGLRIVNFAKTLPLFGWKPYVLTIKDCYLNDIDTSRLKDVESITVFRTKLFPTSIHGYLRIKQIYYNLLGKKNTKMNELEEPNTGWNADNPGPINPSESLIKKLKRYIISLFLVLPDHERNWIFPATFRAIREIKREKIDCILTSSPPVSVHLIGFLVKTLTNVRWVADFRDPWLNKWGGKRNYITCALSLKIDKWLQKKVINKADLVVSSTSTLCEEFAKIFSNEPSGKFQHIPNGFDTANFQKFKGIRKYDVFTLTYIGSLYVGRSPEPIFTAVQKLIKEGRLEESRVKIKLVGQCKSVDGVPTADMARSYGLESVVEVVNRLPYEKALEIISKSHVALLIQPDLPTQIPAKVYDYMGVGARVLSVTEEGATSNLVNSTKIGKSFRAIDIEGISDFICQSVENMSMDGYEDNGFVDKYNIETITEKLVNHISNVQTRFK